MSGGAVPAYLGAVDTVLGGGQRVFPAAPGDTTVNAPSPTVPPTPKGSGAVVKGAGSNGRKYQIRLVNNETTDSAANGAAGDARNKGTENRREAGGIRDNARTTGNALAPSANTPEGMRRLTGSMDERLAAMEQKLDTAKRQNTLLAARLRQLASAYRSNSSSGGSGSGLGNLGSMMSGQGNGGGGGGAPKIPGLSGLSGLSSLLNQRGSGKERPGESALPALKSGKLSLASSPREVAAAILGEASRRGYSRERAIAIVSTGMQESGLNPRAVGGGGAWHGIFQQDTSYGGRGNPNLNIHEFFDRLDAKGGRNSRDIWKSIFWLQQRPGDASAEAAFANGRKAYLTEIQSQLGRAKTMAASILDS